MEIVGWLSSIILLATLLKQVKKQWEAGTKGVSKWLFLGQCAASAGFVVYSASTKNVVFTVTNSLILASALFGAASWFRARDKRAQPETSEAERDANRI